MTLSAAISQQPLFAGDPVRLRRKLESSQGLLREYWTDYTPRFLGNPETRAAMLPLVALLTGEHLTEAKQTVVNASHRLAAEEAGNGVQLHTWCVCGYLLRHVIHFDWLAQRGVWSPAETDAAAAAFLGFGFRHPYQLLTARTRTASNQNLAMALYCAVAGLVFGHKHGAHPTGRFLLEYGLGRLPDFLGLFPQDGYGGEGSTYTSVVNTSLVCWTAELLRQVTGRDWLDEPLPPNGTTLRHMIEMELRLTSPGGWLAPWDHYGWERPQNAAPYAYLARITHNPRPLALIPAWNLWPNRGCHAWAHDDPLWTMVWWPDAFADYDERTLPAELFGWFLPKTGAALDDCPRRARLLQVWDACGDLIQQVGRVQTDPNHLMFEYAGEPVFTDGIAVDGKDPWQWPADKVLATLRPAERERFLRYAMNNGSGTRDLQDLVGRLAPGLVGSANAIVIDEEPWYWPGGSRVGRAERYARAAGLQVVTADCADWYRPRYDVTVVRRTSLWSDAGFGVVLDELQAATPHTWRWQVHLRPQTVVTGQQARVTLPGGQQVLLVWLPVHETRATPLDGYPRTFEGRSCRLELLQRGATAEFTVLIAPAAAQAAIRRLGPGEVEVVIDGRVHRVRVPNAPVAAASPDYAARPDLDVDYDTPAALAEVLRWSAAPAAAAGIDACLAELRTTTPDVTRLQQALHGPDWDVQAAAALVIGQRGVGELAAALCQRLAAEHARPAAAAAGGVNRWRLKTALIVALGRLRDPAGVPLLGRILADNRDFYPVSSVAAQALGRIGGPAALAALGPALAEQEPNTQLRARAAAAACGR